MRRWPLVGRAEEQAYIGEVIGDPAQGGVLVAGRAGVGKTRLVREAVATAPGCHVEFVAATESARSLPFGAFARLLPEHLSAVDEVDLLPVIGRHLIKRADGRPIVLAVDDVHLLDPLSAAFVHYVATAGIATVILTLRSGEPAADAVMRLHHDGILERLELQTISRAEFDELVEVALGGPTEGVTRDRLWAMTAGNILFVRELIDDALDAGTLHNDHGVWRWTGGIGAAPRLHETIAGRLGDLAAVDTSLVELLAVVEPVSLTVAHGLAAGASISDLERRGIVEVETEGRRTKLRLAHPLFGEVVRSAMPVSQRRRIHHALGEHLRSTGLRRQGDPLQLAVWRDAAGEASDPALLADAALRANVLCDYALAERLARASLAAGGGFAASFQMGRAFLGQHRFDETEAVLAPLLGTEPTDDDRERVADVLVQAVGWGLGRVDDGLEIYETTEANLRDLATRALVQAQRATLLMFAARFSDAADVGAAALDAVDDEVVRLRSLAPIAISLAMSGRIEEAVALSEEYLEPAFRLQDSIPRAPAWVVAARASALFFAGRFREALDLMESVLDTVHNLTPQGRAQVLAFVGRYALAQGRPATAVRLLEDAAATIRVNQSEVSARWCLGLAAEAHALLGHHTEASATAAEADSFGRTQILVFEPDERRALAWVDAQAGHTTAAIDKLWNAADLAAARGQRAWEIIILHDLLRLGERGAAERTRDVSDQVDGLWSAAIGTYARAVLSNQAADLEAAANAFATMGSSLLAAELWAEASASRQRDGLPARAAQAARQSQLLAERCEGACTPPLAGAVTRVPLSRRELEIARLAADGSSNVQIAEQLSVSVRTVESHLYAVFAKMGITRRADLSEALQRR